MHDITIRYHGGNQFSNVANHKARFGKEATCVKYLTVIVERGNKGMTNDEIDQLGIMSGNTSSARRSDMLVEGLLEICGEKPTRTGSMAGVVRATKLGLEWLKAKTVQQELPLGEPTKEELESLDNKWIEPGDAK